MRILADENIDWPLVDFLRIEGHDVLWMVEHAPGAADDVIVALSEKEQRVIITFDRDFGELVFHRGLVAPGIALIRNDPVSPDELLKHFRSVWATLEPLISGNFVVVAKNKIRTRPMPQRPQGQN